MMYLKSATQKQMIWRSIIVMGNRWLKMMEFKNGTLYKEFSPQGDVIRQVFLRTISDPSMDTLHLNNLDDEIERLQALKAMIDGKT